MKVIKYQILGATEVYNSETQETELAETFATIIAPYSEEAIKKAESTAYNGEYTIEDDGQPEPDATSTDDILNALLGVSV